MTGAQFSLRLEVKRHFPFFVDITEMPLCFFRFCFYGSCLQNGQMSPLEIQPSLFLGDLMPCGRHYHHCPKHLAKLGDQTPAVVFVEDGSLKW